MDNLTVNSSTILKVEFTHLEGSGKVNVTPSTETSKTGIYIGVDQLDLSKLDFKPVEPKLPLPGSFKEDLMIHAMSSLQDVLNGYLKSRPLILPEELAPVVSSPVVNLWRTSDGAGYVEVLSYCTCNEAKGNSITRCNPKSSICGSRKKREAQQVTTVAVTTTKTHITAMPSSDMHNVKHRNNLDTNGSYLTFFETDSNCRLESVGSTAKVYRLMDGLTCSPLYIGEELTAEFYYYLDNDILHFWCSDSTCQDCAHQNCLLTYLLLLNAMPCQHHILLFFSIR
ncbi:unnamed protein product [Sphagnum tenellum]